MASTFIVRVIAGVALATSMALPALSTESDDAIAAQVPMPEFLDLAPVDRSDIGLPPEPEAAAKPDAAPPVEAPKAEAPPVEAPKVAVPVVVPPPPPAPVIDEAAVKDAIRAQLAERAGLNADDRKARDSVQAAYEARGFKPLWIENGAVGARAKAAMATLAAAADEGLKPADYPVSTREPLDAPALAVIELRLTQSALLYARHAMSGRFEPVRAHPLITPKRSVPKIEDIIAKLGAAADPGATLAGYNPPHGGYQALKALLAEARKAAPEDEPKGPRIPDGKVIKPDGRDPRVPLLRARLGIEGDPTDTVYGGALVEAVRTFQKGRGLEASGVVGKQTVTALNKAPPNRINDLIANMEMWRWLPRDLGSTHILVNIPEFTARIWRNGTLIHRTRVITGKPNTPTPLFSENMQFVIVNPAWNVPPSIVRNEMLPLLASNPGAISRQGLEVMVNGRVVEPEQALGANPNNISFRQPPGERNALGKIKFMFPNPHYVYMHDTPTRALFANERRAYSHGCIRVHEPLKFGEVVFGLGLPGEGWTQARISSQFGPQEREIRFRNIIPVHIAYFTLHIDETGALQSREDVYRHVEQVKALLGLEGQVRMIADPSAPKPIRAKPMVEQQPPEPPNFFELLFGTRSARGG